MLSKAATWLSLDLFLFISFFFFLYLNKKSEKGEFLVNIETQHECMSYFHFLSVDVDGPLVRQGLQRGPEGSAVAAHNGGWRREEQRRGESLQRKPAGLPLPHTVPHRAAPHCTTTPHTRLIHQQRFTGGTQPWSKEVQTVRRTLLLYTVVDNQVPHLIWFLNRMEWT